MCRCSAGFGGIDCSIPASENSCSLHGSFVLATSDDSKFPFDYCECDEGFGVLFLFLSKYQFFILFFFLLSQVGQELTAGRMFLTVTAILGRLSLAHLMMSTPKKMNTRFSYVRLKSESSTCHFVVLPHSYIFTICLIGRPSNFQHLCPRQHSD